MFIETEEAMDEDKLMVQWFELVNAKNDLVRKEADLMYQQRQQELEVLHEELEYDLRCLMDKPGMNSCHYRYTWFLHVVTSRMACGQFVVFIPYHSNSRLAEDAFRKSQRSILVAGIVGHGLAA